jgi:hypothetical protein
VTICAPTIRPLSIRAKPDNNFLSTSEIVPPDSYVPANGLVAHWRAGDVYLGDTDPVSTWYDASGNGNDLFLSFGDAPTLDLSGAFPVVRWNGTQAALDVGNGSSKSLYTGANARTVVLVYQADDVANYYPLAGQTIGSIPSFKIVQNVDKVGVYGVDTVLEVNTVIDTGYRWAIATYDGTDSKIITTDGDNTLTEVLDSDGTFCIGGDLGNPNFLGSIAECLVYDHALTAAEQTALVNYLEDKFSL